MPLGGPEKQRPGAHQPPYRADTLPSQALGWNSEEAQEAEDPVLKALVGGSTASPRASKAAVGQ